jgi:peptide/nickel transport system substrate-binding protein
MTNEIYRPLGRRGVLAGGAALGLLGARRAIAQAPAPRRGGVLRAAYNTEQANLNPALVASNAVYLVATKVIEQLGEMDALDGTLRPLLATGWEGAPDGKTITFRLRPGVKWHDGQDFSAADVQFSAMEVWKPLQNYGRLVFKDLEAVDTPDAHTAVFRFAAPIPMQLVLNAIPALCSVLPKHLYAGTDIRANPHNTMLVGTGPFKLTENKRGEYVQLDRNPDYWDQPKPYLDRILFRVMPDKAAIAAAHEAGEIDISCFSSVPLPDVARLGRLPGLEVVARGYEGAVNHVLVEFNLRTPQLQKLEVRQAIAHALDVPFVIENVFEGYGKAGTGPVPSTSTAFYTPEVARYPFDAARANALLDQAGFPRGANGTRFSLRLRPAPWFEYTRLTGDYLAQALRRVGIETQMQVFDPGAHLSVVYRDHDFDIATGTHAYRNDPAISTTVFYATGTPPGVPWSNQYGYASAAMDAIIREGAAEIDTARRVEIYRRFQKLAMDDIPILPLVEHGFLSVVSRRLVNHHNNPRWAMASWHDLAFSA